LNHTHTEGQGHLPEGHLAKASNMCVHKREET